MKKIVTALLLLSTVVSFGQEKVLLRLNVKKGDKYQTHMVMKQDMGVMVMDMEMIMDMLVEEAKSKDYNVKNQFTYFSTKMEQGGQKLNYNSKMKEEELNAEQKKFANTMKPLLETIIFLNMDKLGNSKLIKLVPEVAGVTKLKDQMSTVIYPEEAVEVGSTWENTQKTNGAEMVLTYKVTKITKDFVFADISGKIDLIPGAKINGSVQIDRNSGMASAVKMDIDANMMGMSMKTNSEVTIKKI